MAASSQALYIYNGPVVTTAASPLVSAWFNVAGYARVLPWFAFAGGTSVHSLEGSWDGSTLDADFVYAAPTSGTAFDVISPYIRWRTVQTVADATKSKIYLTAVVGR